MGRAVMQQAVGAGRAARSTRPPTLFFFSARSWAMTSLEVMEEPEEAPPAEVPVMAPAVRTTATAFLPAARPKALGLTLLYFL